MSSFKSEPTKVLVLATIGLLVASAFLTSSYAQAEQPVYAKPGSFVYYVIQGAFIAFFDGVTGNISYTVKSVFPNGSMALQVSANVSSGTEVPESYQLLNYTDSVNEPRTFPAVPVANLSDSSIFFQNITANFVRDQNISLDPGEFNTAMYQGVDKNGTSYQFWFDRSTGIAVQMASNNGAAMQLESSNVVTPFAASSPTSIDVPFYEAFGVAAVVSAFAFGGLYWYYKSKNKKLLPKQSPKISRKK
ncbi:MAG: hypothetical protein ACYCQJ_07565 [Nitrososphaerales archaeon]